ncbi:unnamed protein product [Lepidochelys kempii]
MYGKGKSNSSVPSDSQAREKLALYVYEYLLHVGAQKSAQTFLSEIRWEKNITLGEPPGFLHSWWCVFWDLYCAAPERRETCEHSSEAKAFHDYSAAAAPSPVLGNIPPGDGMPVGPVPPGFFQPFMSPRYPGGPRPPLRIPNQALGGVPGSQPLLPSGMDPTRQQGHPNMGGPMQRMTPPRGMVPLGPQNYGGAMRPPLNALGGPGMPGMNMGPGGGRPWPNPTNANSIPYSSASPGNYVGPPGGGGPPGTPIMPSPADSTNSGDNMYTLMNAVPPGPNRSNFPMGPGSDGPMGGLGGMESHHMNGSLGSGDMDSISKNSPSNMSMSNQPGTPRDEGEMGGNFLNPFQSEILPQHDNECVIHTKSPHEDRSELALFRELLQKKITRPSVQFNKRISDTTRPTIFSYHLPSFVKKVGPNMIQTTIKSGITELPKSELQTIILCMYKCG